MSARAQGFERSVVEEDARVLSLQFRSYINGSAQKFFKRNDERIRRLRRLKSEHRLRHHERDEQKRPHVPSSNQPNISVNVNRHFQTRIILILLSLLFSYFLFGFSNRLLEVR